MLRHEVAVLRRTNPRPRWMGRSRGPRRADPAPAAKAANPPTDHLRHHAPVAPPLGHPEVDIPEPDRTTASQRRDHRADRAVRHRERVVGVSADPGRATQARSRGRRVHDPPGSQGVADPSRQPGRMFRPVAGGVYEVCPVAACGAGRVVVDQVVRRDRLLGDPQEPVLPALGDWGSWSGASRFSPHRPHRPSCLDSRRTVQESSGGLTFWRRCVRYPARAGSSGDAPPLTRVCHTISVQDGFGR